MDSLSGENHLLQTRRNDAPSTTRIRLNWLCYKSRCPKIHLNWLCYKIRLNLNCKRVQNRMSSGGCLNCVTPNFLNFWKNISALNCYYSAALLELLSFSLL